DNAPALVTIVDALAEAHGRGVEVVLVSSGAIASALPFFGLEARPKDDLVTEQAAAAVGQTILMDRYRDALRPHDIVGAQILLTASDFDNESTRVNAQAALSKLLSLRFLPIVNENDTVATHEIRFGDNDRLAALVATLVNADVLVLLSDVDALYSKPPQDAGAEKIDFVTHEDDLAGIVIGGNGSLVGTGGAETKVQAARHATESGIPVILTSAANVGRALAGDEVGTWFEAKPGVRNLD
ncbi:MAG: glutamate 5-kinase, partial [Microbacteriaceae bacterium]